MTDNLKAALSELAKNGPGALAIKHFSMARDLGYVERDSGVTVARGYVGASITAKGRAALA